MDEAERAIIRKKKHEEKLRRQEAQRRRIQKSVSQCFSTDAGKETMRWLMNECGFNKPSVIYNSESGDIKVDATVYNEAKRDIYLRIRSMLSHDPKLLAEIEHNIKGE